MIENATIVHSTEQFPLFTWSTPWPALNTVVIAILTTVLSYQTTAALSDLLAGWKPKGKTTASQIHSHLLSNEKSTLHTLAAIMRLDILDRIRLRHRASIPSSMTIERNTSSVRFLVLGRLILLLAIPPSINVLSIVLALERDTILTVANSKFQGVSVGVLRELTPIRERGATTVVCHHVPTRFGENEDSLMDFSLCSGLRPSIPPTLGPDTNESLLEGYVEGATQVTAVNLPRGSISVSFKQRLLERSYAIWLDVNHEDGIFRTKPRWNVDDARALVRKAMDTLILFCTIEAGQKPALEGEVKHEAKAGGVIRAWGTVGCEASDGTILLSSTEVAGMIGMVNSKGFWLGEVNTTDTVDADVAEFFDGESLSLIRRRRSLAPIGILSIATVAVIIVRLTVNALVHADIDDALDAAARKGLGLSSVNGETLLGVKDTFRIDHKYQWGKKAYLGLRIDNMEEVSGFDVGILGTPPIPKE